MMRSISRWVAPPLSSVQMVVCRCGFKTFTPLFPRSEGVEINVLPVGLRGARRTVFNASDHPGQGGAVWVATSGALWVAAGAGAARRTGLVYIAAFAPDAGESAGGLSHAIPPAAIASLAPDSDGYLWAKYDKFQESFCQDLTADEALVMAVAQKAPLASTFGDNVTAPAWKKKPSWYQISSEDRTIDPENQRKMAARMAPRKTVTLAEPCLTGVQA
ncbi:alpha/beta hydrolase fold domain-containing protein [Variovorax paradoxus B4]|uniref:Alpha/beta hydrolase fold domain-containing protein n=1 Tax=Variovorax paradoxus B4 TaxID=1246301 RepID=T1XLL7_VARPD|nr:alpha/beta hydrolase fold domain-containing protein [Variovorax paradoxus B4]